MGMTPYVAVVGPGIATAEEEALAEEVGRRLALAGAVLVCGGSTGVMSAVSLGAVAEGGTVVGILPGHDRAEANPHVTVAIPTGMGEMRNALIARAADVVIAVGGEFGTLSEIALALKAGKPVVAIGSWEIEGVQAAGDAAGAVQAVLAAAA
jgi:uncharacterized protein (TIGR00725 family)